MLHHNLDTFLGSFVNLITNKKHSLMNGMGWATYKNRSNKKRLFLGGRWGRFGSLFSISCITFEIQTIREGANLIIMNGFGFYSNSDSYKKLKAEGKLMISWARTYSHQLVVFCKKRAGLMRTPLLPSYARISYNLFFAVT